MKTQAEWREITKKAYEDLWPVYKPNGTLICFITTLEYAMFVEEHPDTDPGLYVITHAEHPYGLISSHLAMLALSEAPTTSSQEEWEKDNTKAISAASIMLDLKKRQNEVNALKSQYPESEYPWMYPDFYLSEEKPNPDHVGYAKKLLLS